MMKLYYSDWFSETDPKPNGFDESELRPDVYKKGDLHQILRLAKKEFEVTRSLSEPFIFNVHIRLSPDGELRKDLNEIIPQSVLSADYLLVFTDDEGYDAGPLKVRQQCLDLDIDLDRVLYLTPSMKCIEEQLVPTMFYGLDWNELRECLLSRGAEYKSILKLPTVRLLSSLTAYPDPHKIFITNALYKAGLTNGNYVTCQTPVEGREDTEFLKSLYLVDKLPLGQSLLLDEQGDFDVEDMLLNTIRIFRQSTVNIVSTSPTGRYRRSKTRRWSHIPKLGLGCALLSERPFVLHSEYPSLEYFKSYGFKSFHPYVDESYDSIDDPDLKAKAIVDVVQRTNFNTREIRHICLSNLKHFLRNDYNLEIGKYIENKLLR